jgi:hypothetical protein
MAHVVAATSNAELAIAVAAWAVVVIYIVVAWFAGGAVREAARMRRQQADVQRAEARPYVFVTFDLSNRRLIHLKVENVGRTAARDVEFLVDPPIESHMDNASGTHASAFLAQHWPILPPNSSLRAVFDDPHRRLAPDNTLPMRYCVTAKYSASATDDTYEEAQIIDLEVYLSINYIPEHDFHDLVETLKDVRDAVAQARTMGYPRVATKTSGEYETEPPERVSAPQSLMTVDPSNDLLDILSHSQTETTDVVDQATQRATWASVENEAEEGEGAEGKEEDK